MRQYRDFRGKLIAICTKKPRDLISVLLEQENTVKNSFCRKEFHLVIAGVLICIEMGVK